MIRYAITDRTLLAADEPARRAALLTLAARWAADGIDYIQLREKGLTATEFEEIARAIAATIYAVHGKTKLLINSGARVFRIKTALAIAADGIHLTSSETRYTPTIIRNLFAQQGLPSPVVSVSCHTQDEVVTARCEDASFILFGPVFGKTVAGDEVVPAAGLEVLRVACQTAQHIPVLALGGITLENAPLCFAAGAQGIAGIRLYTSKP